jgi:hypothetical protein
VELKVLKVRIGGKRVVSLARMSPPLMPTTTVQAGSVLFSVGVSLGSFDA